MTRETNGRILWSVGWVKHRSTIGDHVRLDKSLRRNHEQQLNQGSQSRSSRSRAARRGAPARSAADGTIVLGAAVSLTGKYSTNGKNTQDGYNLAVKTINDKGGVKVGNKHYELKVIYYDDESTSARGAQLVERLISQDHVNFVLGPYSSALTKAIAPVTEKYKIPMVEGNGADRSLFTQGYKYMFAVLNTSDYYLRSAVTHPRRRSEEGRPRSEVAEDRDRDRERQLLAGRA